MHLLLVEALGGRKSLYSTAYDGSGRLLPQGGCSTTASPNNRYPLLLRHGFIHLYVFPDDELVGPGHVVSAMHDAGFELRHEEVLREHYACTLTAWEDNLEAHWSEAVAEVG